MQLAPLPNALAARPRRARIFAVARLASIAHRAMTALPILAVLCALQAPAAGFAAEPPLRVFIRSGPKTHGPGAHDHPRFLREWVPLLQARGAQATGGDAFPTREQLEQTDVVILHAQEAGNIAAADRVNLDAFLQRGGGLVVIHAGVVSRDPDWLKKILGGAWRYGTTKWREGPMRLSFTDRNHPITRGTADWAMDDEIYYEMDLQPDAHVLATGDAPSPRAAPQIWTYEKTAPGGSKSYRAVVSIPGHFYETFNRPAYRNILLRAIAWTGQRANVDEFVGSAEIVAPVNSAPTAGPKQGARGDAPLPETKPVQWQPDRTKVLIIAGGSAHNFGRFFGETDSAILAEAGFAVHYTEDREQAATELAHADVALISVNRKYFDTPEYRRALFDFAAAGKGIVLLHSGAWYSYPEWPELNAKLVGGGARGHDKLGPYTVRAVKPEHPILHGVPASFAVEDELYYVNPEPGKIPSGTVPIEVLAETSPSARFKQPHPAVWITPHDRARIVAITLGHDQRVHDLPAFRTLLVNAVRWSARQ